VTTGIDAAPSEFDQAQKVENYSGALAISEQILALDSSNEGGLIGRCFALRRLGRNADAERAGR
jgi:hypothetical protein